MNPSTNSASNGAAKPTKEDPLNRRLPNDKTGDGKKPRGAPVGNQNHLTHGYYSLVTTLKRGHLDRRTMLGRYRMEKEKELATSLGGDPSTQQWILIRDTVTTLLYLGSIDAYLLGLKSAIKRGKLHGIIVERGKLASHVRENLKALGLERRTKRLGVLDTLGQASEDGSRPFA